MKRIILLALVTSFLQAATTTSTYKYGQYNPKDKFDLEFVLASEQTKNRDNEVDGSYNSLKSSLLYKANKHNEFRFYISSIYEINDERGKEYTWELAEVMWRSKRFITQQKHGVDLELEMKKYNIIDTDLRNRYGFDGAFIPQLIVKRSWGRRFSVEAKFRRHFYDRNNAEVYTLAKEDRIYFTPNVFLTRSLMFNTQFKYRHKIRSGEYYSRRSRSVQPKEQEIVTAHPSLMYFLNRKAMVEFYVETEIKNSNDERSRSQLMKDKQVLGAALYLDLL